ncbi:tRNA lysidine(34) synthetase TilS [Paenibacillus abyssi]|uniref:tRNA(Ile)-lysidine synthase n=1 Tax=Paenibacillus abyssi TaxID=1340531 RepID=A0A917G687_9BACL|nr:tRNA lysidine(34) synthetase TilS [Paenibacillus abyssi]GGG24827.1 tRNA(Ile)-lysidine synthase [Paenibacillus abyssi]
MEELMKRVLQTAGEHRLWQPGDTVIVALSGGPDSTALLHVLYRIAAEQRLTLVAAHVNHGFRVEESEVEAQLVQRYCEQLGVPCEIARLNVPAYMEETKLNAQLAARELRYAYLEQVAQRYNASRIALGHHADDQAETVLMRLIRGTGTGGLAGIMIKRQEKNVELIRPLLRINKSDILSYCQEHELPYSTDSSNLQRYYFRNVVRLDILPFLENYNPQLTESLNRLSELAGADDDFMEQQTADLFGRLVRQVPGGFRVQRGALLKLHVALQRRLIKLILNYLALEMESASFDRVESVRYAAMDDKNTIWRTDLGDGIRFIREYDTLQWLNGQPLSGGDYEYPIVKETQRVVVAEAGVEFIVDFINPDHEAAGAKPHHLTEVWFDPDEIRFPLIIRNRRPGDRMAVLGLNGTKKVQDMFVDDKVPATQRELMPILCDAEGRLLWIPGIRRSSYALPRSAGAAVLRVRKITRAE